MEILNVLEEIITCREYPTAVADGYMCDFYGKWIKGLKSVYGLDFDAIGCRNESGERFSDNVIVLL